MRPISRTVVGTALSILFAALGLTLGGGTAGAYISDPGNVTWSSTASTVTVAFEGVQATARPIGCDIRTVSSLGTTEIGRIWLDDQGNGTYTSPPIKGLAKTSTYCYDQDIIGYEYPTYEAAYPGEPEPCLAGLASLLQFMGSSQCSGVSASTGS